MKSLRNQLEELREHSDITVLIVSSWDSMMMNKSHVNIPNIDVIIGGHTHHIFHEGKTVDDTLLACGGKYGMFVGHICLTIDQKKGSYREKGLAI